MSVEATEPNASGMMSLLLAYEPNGSGMMSLLLVVVQCGKHAAGCAGSQVVCIKLCDGQYQQAP